MSHSHEKENIFGQRPEGVRAVEGIQIPEHINVVQPLPTDFNLMIEKCELGDKVPSQSQLGSVKGPKNF